MPLNLPETDACYFCEIIDGRSDRWNVLAEEESTLTLLNGRQFEDGQCLVVSRRHAPTILDLTAQESASVMRAARVACEILVRAFNPDGVLLYQNNGTGSGQEVPHFHLHVVPRRENSDWGFGPPHVARLESALRPNRDHTQVTDDKRRTVERLRRLFRARS